jgi:hypothetical protein
MTESNKATLFEDIERLRKRILAERDGFDDATKTHLTNIDKAARGLASLLKTQKALERPGEAT